jgi:hypothetical protein
MKNGDISNETPPRLIVNIAVVTNSEVVENKKFLKGIVIERKIISFHNHILSKLWTLSATYGLSIELAAFASEFWTQEHLNKLMDKMENRGGNPFNYAELYDNFEAIITELPYRPNLRGVVDLRERVARYGSWGIELDNL